ncbi:short-chain dehydrogenase/reductase [Dyadobacter beijingensis]|uniref:Short-chain dehydrogenase/reductase n=1 Tax=Dyadobacter beijingensis TaxID=365489 RepID=A0ABQ2IKC0_9BACT|nr:SDR family NAD(P)-dependent oxidoreductase [Dyadobacter beijingensis]GGN12165.1 short-chain dehydrogenase/reductase [Dyadobacter beijingensis]
MKNIILTGSSSGFGRVTAQVLARDGHRVFATMRDPFQRNRMAAQQLLDWAELHHARIEVIDLDVTCDESVQTAVAEIARQTGGRIDVLINNAGSAYIGLNETLSAAQTDQLFQVNVIGVDRMIKAVLPYMHQRKSGLIVTLSSVAARQPIPVMGVYGATKAAVDALTVSYHYELASTGIDVVLVQPGAFPSTDIVSNQPVPANPGAAQYYGHEMERFRASVVKTFTPGPFKPESIEVAYTIRNIVDAPPGLRSLWTIVHGGFKEQSVRHINQATRELVDTVLQAAGISDEIAVP